MVGRMYINLVSTEHNFILNRQRLKVMFQDGDVLTRLPTNWCFHQLPKYKVWGIWVLLKFDFWNFKFCSKNSDFQESDITYVRDYGEIVCSVHIRVHPSWAVHRYMEWSDGQFVDFCLLSYRLRWIRAHGNGITRIFMKFMRRIKSGL